MEGKKIVIVEQDGFEPFNRAKLLNIGMLESEDIAVNQILIDSKAWSKNFRSSIFTDWFQIFTSFSKFFRKQYKQKIVLKNYKHLRTNLFLKKDFPNLKEFKFPGEYYETLKTINQEELKKIWYDENEI